MQPCFWDVVVLLSSHVKVLCVSYLPAVPSRNLPAAPASPAQVVNPLTPIANMVTTRERNQQAGPEPVTAEQEAPELTQQQEQASSQQQQQSPKSSKKRQKKGATAGAGPQQAVTPSEEDSKAAGAVEMSHQAECDVPAVAAVPAVDPSADLLPAELLQQLSNARKSSIQSPSSNPQQQRHQSNHKQQHKHQQKQKRRLVQVQKGPVKVAVLPAVAAAAEAGTALSAAAAVRQQLLESRIQRSKVMLQPAGPGMR